MTRTHKNLKIVCVKFFDKIGSTLVADLAYVIVHHLKIDLSNNCQRNLPNI